jgi:predicted TPR repeat methyltransferase
MEVRADLLFRSSGDLLADRRYGIAIDLAARGDRESAVDVLMQAIEMAPAFASAWFALGELQETLGDCRGAADAFRRAQAADPEDRHGAGLRLARLDGQAPDAMPAGYLRTLFDQYASRFDTALEGLGYRAPALLLAAIENDCVQRARPMRFKTVLDLGCGTGLVGAAIRPLCEQLVGVDQSSQMINRARQKGIYDRLEVAEIGTFMRAERDADASYDLILAGDVLPYLCDLAPILANAASLLNAEAGFGFTVETHADAGVILGKTLRYAHGEPYVRNAIASAGLVLHSLVPASTRNEGGTPVAGLVVIARRV